MNRATLIRLAFAACLLGFAGSGAAQHALQTITLKHRTAEQVLPALRSLLEPGATITGHANRLIVRASPATVDDLRLALEALDRPLRRLQISVRFEHSRDASAGERVEQRIQVVEGSRALVYSGQSRPVRQLIHTPGGVVSQQVLVVHDQNTGFYLVPTLSGETVHLQFDGGSLAVPLGQWIELGSVSAAAAYRSEMQGMSLKVEELQN